MYPTKGRFQERSPLTLRTPRNHAIQKGSGLTFPRSLSLQGSQWKCWSRPGCHSPPRDFLKTLQGHRQVQASFPIVMEDNLVSGQEET